MEFAWDVKEATLASAVQPTTPSAPGFSLLAGGPAYRLQHWLGLTKPGAPNLARRVALCILLTWIPLLVITALEGRAVGQAVRIPFLHDFHAYALFLAAIPLLILAEGVIERHLPRVATHFVHAGLVATVDVPAYESALARAVRWRDSSVMEVILLGLTASSVAVAYREFPFDFSTWRSFVSGAEHTRTAAGWWELLVGRTLFQFLCWRWLWRLFIWYGFLARMSRLPLRLIPTHPDRAAGLGFVGDAQRFFWVVALAISAVVAGGLADEVVYKGVPLNSYAFGIGGLVVLLLLVFLGPLLMFTPRLIDARIKSEHDYSALAVAHNLRFDDKWVKGDHPKADSIVGSPDVSSLADLGNAYDILGRMRPIPFDPSDALALAVATLMPMAPLLLTVYPLDQVLDLLWKVVV